ncbi:MAG: T9SS type A sorting domain-containing protein [Calditrichaceae bacterium]|nr:T9SS type A sorting domain-containing protein [Calditrichaceae bacterium]RQV95794.1 MAG: T9SS C-terminal target domain-containing protein [Calditrichota bacterium]
MQKLPRYSPTFTLLQRGKKIAEEWYNAEILSGRKAKRIPALYRKRIYSAFAALLLSTGLLSAGTKADSTHFIPLPGDVNSNALSYAEEIYLGVFEYGQNENCQIYAKLFTSIIDSLPTDVKEYSVYRIDHYVRGVIPCPKCGENINMGYVEIINPMRNLKLELPYMALHFMENGYFSYGSDINYQRVDIDTLKRILYPYDPKHMLKVLGDSDGDGLTDAEEDSLWLDDWSMIPDADADSVPDGAQVAEELIRLFPKLKLAPDSIHSHVKFHPVYGMENCKICGSTHNMGSIEIINPENKKTIHIPYISLHALAHGSFAYNGTEHEKERTDAVDLYRTMKTHMLFIDNDSDEDGLKDNEEEYFGYDPGKADTNSDGIYDGMELALVMTDSIKKLPTTPQEDQPYVEYLDMDGLQVCSVCGKDFPMGLMKIYNPLMNTIEPFEISYYAFHFMGKGSFAYEGSEDGRIDPIKLSQYLNYVATSVSAPASELNPFSFTLLQNSPNPFNPQTTIRYHLKKHTNVVLKVYDLQGREVKTLLQSTQNAGEYSVNWNGIDKNNKQVSSGFYIYELQAGSERQSKKMLLLK